MSRVLIVVFSFVLVSELTCYPHSASFDVEAVDGYRTCSGSLISRTKILTAASCFDTSELILSLIALGESTSDLDTVYKEAEEVFIHEEYNRQPLENDIALIRIQPVGYSENVQPIILVDYDTNTELNQLVIVAGIPDNEKNTFNIMSNRKCASILQKAIMDSNLCLFDPIICTEFWARGGAVFLRGVNTLDMQLGLISNVTEEGLQDTPIAVTRIGAYLSWIKNRFS